MNHSSLAQRVANTQFVEHIGIIDAQIGNNQVSQPAGVVGVERVKLVVVRAEIYPAVVAYCGRGV